MNLNKEVDMTGNDSNGLPFLKGKVLTREVTMGHTVIAMMPILVVQSDLPKEALKGILVSLLLIFVLNIFCRPYISENCGI